MFRDHRYRLGGFCIMLLVSILVLSISGGCATRNEKQGTKTSKAVYVAPPGFYGEGIPVNPPLWSPNSTSKCDVAYISNMTGQVPYNLAGGIGYIPNETNYFFYFPSQKEVYTFIDPRIPRDYPKPVLSGDYGIVVKISYTGGFPTNVSGWGLYDILSGEVTHPVPGDKWSRVIESRWPFIRRKLELYNMVDNCTVNPVCFCLKTP